MQDKIDRPWIPGGNMSGLVHARSGFLSVNGANLYYEAAGSGDPLLLIHGGLGDSRMWDDQFPVFAERFHVVRFDQRGFGKSSMPSGRFAYHEDVRTLLQELELPRAHIVGLSFGALVAIDFALAYPDMVRSLVLASPAVGGASWSEAMLARFGQVDDAAERDDLEAAVEIENEIWVYGPNRTASDVDPEVRRKMTGMNRLVWQRESEAEGTEPEELDPPAAERLAEIKAPTLVIVGQGDVPDIADRGAMIAREVAGVHVESIPEVAHQLNMERPDVFTRLVIDFCSTV